MKPKIIDWRITPNCNQQCLYCYATDYQPTLFFDATKDKKIIAKIIEIGCESVCISGGEPLLDENGERAYRIIKALNDKGLSVFLSTNGTNFLLLENKYGISKYLSKLSLPLDGYDEESSRRNGHADTLKYVKDILEYFNRAFHDGKRIPNIKVSTVVTRNNINDKEYWENLCKFINQYPIIKLWKIYDFVPENRGNKNKNVLSYNASEFDTLSDNIQKHIKAEGYNIIKESIRRISRSQTYFIIRPDGSVIIPKDNYDKTEEVVVGNLLQDDIDKIIKDWNSKIDFQKCAFYSNVRAISDIISVPRMDEVTRAILNELETSENKNYPYSRERVIEKVSKQTNTSKKVVAEKFSNLKKENALIRDVIPIINLPVLGFQVYLANLVFNKSAGFTADQIAEVICKSPAVGWCAHYNLINTPISGYNQAFDDKLVFRISIFAENAIKYWDCLENIIDEINRRYGVYYSKSTDYVPELFVNFDEPLKQQRDEEIESNVVVFDELKFAVLDKDEKNTLSAMSEVCNSGDLCFETLSSKLQNKYNWKRHIIPKKLKAVIDSLRAKGIIKEFQLVTNDNTLGLKTFLIIYDLYPMHKQNERELITQFKNHIKQLFGITHYNVLYSDDRDIDVEIKVQTRGELAHIASRIEEKFGNEIRNSQYLELVKEYKFEFLIQVINDAINK